MNARRLAQIALLAVVALTLVLVFRPRADQDAASAVQDASVSQATWVAYYFHGDVRCDTCRSIEAQAEAAVRDGFAPELAAGTLAWQVVNFDEPANAHFIEDYGLTHSTVVLVERDGDATRRFTSLDRVWELVHEEDGLFRDYVQAEVASWVRPGA